MAAELTEAEMIALKNKQLDAVGEDLARVVRSFRNAISRETAIPDRDQVKFQMTAFIRSPALGAIAAAMMSGPPRE